MKESLKNEKTPQDILMKFKKLQLLPPMKNIEDNL